MLIDLMGPITFSTSLANAMGELLNAFFMRII